MSHWTLGYLATLILPTLTALLCRDRVLPVGIEDVSFHVDEHGTIVRMVIAGSGTVRRAGDPSPRFTTLVAGHLQPIVASCASHGGLSTRVLWGNAAVLIAFIRGELLATTTVIDAPGSRPKRCSATLRPTAAF